jgi:hypothetical protein
MCTLLVMMVGHGDADPKMLQSLYMRESMELTGSRIVFVKAFTPQMTTRRFANACTLNQRACFEEKNLSKTASITSTITLAWTPFMGSPQSFAMKPARPVAESPIVTACRRGGSAIVWEGGRTEAADNQHRSPLRKK